MGLVAPDQVCFLAVRDGHELKAVIPLHFGENSRLRMPVRVASVAYPHDWPFGEVVAPDDDVRTALLPLVLEFLRGPSNHGAHLLTVGPAPVASRLWEGLAGGRGSCFVGEIGDDLINCTGDFETYRAGLSKNFRNNLRKARNKLASLPDVRFISVTEPDAVVRELRTFIKLEVSGWKGRTPDGEPMARDDRFVRFYEGLYTAFAASGLAEVNALYSGDTCLASQLCVRSGRMYEMHKIAFDERFAKMAPGQLLFEHTTQRCFEDESVHWLDLTSDAGWHSDWGAAPKAMQRVYLPVDSIGWLMMPLVKARFGPVRTIVRFIKKRRHAARRQ